MHIGGIYATSNHAAEIDGVDGYCGIYAAYGNKQYGED